jgi:ankyrin repeat protein
MSAALKTAVEANDPAAVREALQSVPDVNAKLFDGKNAVAVACALGADRALAALLEVKAKVQGQYTEHPFVIAAEHQRHAVMQLLFDRKKVSEDAMESSLLGTIREGRNETLQFILRQFKPQITVSTIRLAGQFRHPEIIRSLAAAGVDMNTGGKDGSSALHDVVRSGDINTTRTMVECGADVNARNERGVTPLMRLADGAFEFDRQIAGYHQFHERLKERAREQPERAEEILNSSAAKEPCPPSADAVVGAFLHLGADAKLKDNEGNDAIDYYRFERRRNRGTQDNPKFIELLQSAGATGDSATVDLYAAIDAQDIGAVRAAIAAGADVNRINPAANFQHTPLTLASGRGLLDIVNALLEAGADPNKPANLDRPLLAACQDGHLPVVQRLIEGGADVALRHTRALAGDCPAMNAYETAQWMKKKEVMKFLKSIGADKIAKAATPEPGIHSWDDFAEVLVKGDVPSVAAALAKMIGGRLERDVYGKTVTPGKQAFLVVRAVGMDWCNVFQLAPRVDWLNDTKAGQKFASEISNAAVAPARYIGYTDTSDAAMTIRYEPGTKPKRKNGKESDNDWLTDLAREEKFMAAAFGPEIHDGQPIDILFSDYPAEAFDGTMIITK